jgi:hypothetical protein
MIADMHTEDGLSQTLNAFEQQAKREVGQPVSVRELHELVRVVRNPVRGRDGAAKFDRWHSL